MKPKLSNDILSALINVFVPSISHNLVIHRSVGSSRGSSSGWGTCTVRGAAIADEVIGHLRVKFLGSLPSRAATAGAATTNFPGASLLVAVDVTLLSTSNLGNDFTALGSCRGLWLGLGLSDALTQRLRLRNQFGFGDNNLDLNAISFCCDSISAIN